VCILISHNYNVCRMSHKINLASDPTRDALRTKFLNTAQTIKDRSGIEVTGFRYTTCIRSVPDRGTRIEKHTKRVLKSAREPWFGGRGLDKDLGQYLIIYDIKHS